MAQGLRSLRWRAALGVAGVVLVFAFVRASGRTTYVIQIDFSWGRDFLEGAVVEIDGDSVGTLQRYGRSQYHTGFEVEEGDHVVRVLREGCDGMADTVRLSRQGSRFEVLMADVDDGFTCRVVLR